MTTTTVYCVVTQDHMIRHWFFATKKEASVFAVNWRAENDPEGEYESPEIDAIVVDLNARGVAKALNDFVDMTCANEG